MAAFTDNVGRSWIVAFTPSVVDDLRRLIGLPSPALPRFWSAVRNPETMVNALFVTCREQAERRGVNDEQFGAALFSPAAISAAADALVAASVPLIRRQPRKERR